MTLFSLRLLLFVSLTVVLGCAPWSIPTASDYVTVENDSRHDEKQARKLYDKARKLMTKHPQGEECDLGEVEKLLQQSLVCDVRFGPAHHALGMLYFWQNKLYLAAWEFEYAARLMPDRFEPLNNLGLVYESAGKFDQAKMYYCLAREKAKLNPDVVGNIARVSLRGGQTVNEIRPLLDDVIATDSRPAWQSWARESLGIRPNGASNEFGEVSPAVIYDSVPPNAESEPMEVEELPLIAPPPPGASTPADTLDQSIKNSFEVEPTLGLDFETALNAEMGRR